jgi:regulator of telomere elongation helicase 1
LTRFCPYFAARDLKEKADIIFMPYNYLLDAKVCSANKFEHNSFRFVVFKARRIHKINVRKCIVIFDEAHNIEQQCEDAASVAISSMDLAGCLDDITQVMQWMSHTHSASSELVVPNDVNDENKVDSNG